MSLLNLRIYWEDTDAAGVVYYANYLKFAERGRTEMLRAMGVEQTQLLASHGVAFVVSRCEIDYRRPAKLDDAIAVHTQLREVGKVRMTMHQTITRQQDVLAELVVKLACVNQQGRPAPLPDFLADMLHRHLTENA